MVVSVFGKRGSGKTTLIGGQLKDARGPVVVLDILGNFEKVEGSVTVSSIGEMIEAIKDYLQLSKTADLKNIPKIIVLKAADPDQAVDYASAALWHGDEGGTLVIDEADGFNFSNAPCYDQLMRYGRNRNIDVVTGCRRPAEVSRNITAGAGMIFAFGSHEPRDVDYFSATVFGRNAEKLLTIEKYHGLYVDYQKMEQGIFRIDETGKIFIMSVEKL